MNVNYMCIIECVMKFLSLGNIPEDLVFSIIYSVLMGL